LADLQGRSSRALTARRAGPAVAAATLILLAACGVDTVRSSPVALPSGCPAGRLPAYAHNDYENDHPLADALSAGYAGVEADVFLVNGTLRVGHDRRAASRGGALESLYVAPLAELVERCGRITPAGAPFLLAIDIKEPSRPTYDEVVRLLSSHGGAFTFVAGQPRGPVEVVMVGWVPPDDAGVPASRILRHRRIAGHADTVTTDPQSRVALLSLDYGKTIGRPWRTRAGRARWLATLAAAKRLGGERRLRVHNVPVDSTVYAELLRSGVDLIGTKELRRSRSLLWPD
jgi:hypothetical protein